MPAGQTDLTGLQPRVHPGTVSGFDEHEYKLRLRFFPYSGPFMTGIRDISFHVAETRDLYVEGIYWMAISDGRVGVALFNRGLMGSVHEKDGALSSVLAFALPYIWGTRMLTGKYTYELGILPFLGDWRAADLHHQAMEYNLPFVVREESAVQEPLGEVWTPYVEQGDGKAILSALYTRQGKTYARFFEYQGGNAEVAFEWLDRPARLTAVDLREREQGGLGQRALLGPWQVQTVRVDGCR